MYSVSIQTGFSPYSLCIHYSFYIQSVFRLRVVFVEENTAQFTCPGLSERNMRLDRVPSLGGYINSHDMLCTITRDHRQITWCKQNTKNGGKILRCVNYLEKSGILYVLFSTFVYYLPWYLMYLCLLIIVGVLWTFVISHDASLVTSASFYGRRKRKSNMADKLSLFLSSS